MIGLEIVMNLDTLEIFDVIDHDKNGNSEQAPTAIQLSLFDSMTCIWQKEIYWNGQSSAIQ